MAGVAGSIKDFEDRAVAFNGDDGQKALSAERKAQLSTPIGGGGNLPCTPACPPVLLATSFRFFDRNLRSVPAIV
jgi:hypothetical protein